jgi:hypothetical protein
MGKHKAENHVETSSPSGEERLFTELILGLDGERDKNLQPLFELVKDTLTENNNDDKKLCFAYCMGIARAYAEKCVGYIEEGSQLSTEDGWTLVFRDTDGYSLWYMADMDLIGLQRAFYK